jgi:DNA end-binding protein Ku
MAARAAWKGNLRIAGISMAVRAFSGKRTNTEVSFRQLHRDCGQRIEQHRICPSHGKIEYADIVSGYEHGGDYLPVEAEELKSCEPFDRKEIEIECCLDAAQVDASYHAGQTYYLVPDSPVSQRAFAVLRDALQNSARVGFAKLVIYRRQHLVLVRARGRLLALTVLEYPQRVQEATEYEAEVKVIEPTEQELTLFGQLLDGLTDPHFALDAFEDPYAAAVCRLVQTKLADGHLPAPRVVAPAPEAAPPETAEAEQLLASLLQSLGRRPRSASSDATETTPDRDMNVKRIG